MNDSAKLHLGQLALLSAFFDDDGFDALARDERFGRYVVTQKELLRTLLVRGYRLLAGASPGSERAGETPALPTQASAAPVVAPPSVAPPPVLVPAVVVPAVTEPPVAAAAPAGRLQAAPAPTRASSGATAPLAAAAAAPLAPDEVLRVVTELCAGKTGYPLDLLEPQLDLEADLGVDTIKQMELVAAVRERFGIARVEGYSLKQTPTLASLRDFVLAHPTGR